MSYHTSEKTALLKANHKAHLARVAAEVFARQGYHETSVKDIVEAAKMSVGSFYFYFQNKEDIFASLYRSMSDIVFDNLQQALLPASRGIISRFVRGELSRLRSYQEHRDLAHILLIEGVGLNATFRTKRQESINRSLELKLEVFTSLQNKGLLSDMDLRIAALAFDGSANNVILDWLHSGKTTGLTETAPSLIRYGLQALGISFNIKEIDDEITVYWNDFPALEIL